VSYLSASAVVIHYEEALYQVYAPLRFTFTFTLMQTDRTSTLYRKTIWVTKVIFIFIHHR